MTGRLAGDAHAPPLANVRPGGPTAGDFVAVSAVNAPPDRQAVNGAATTPPNPPDPAPPGGAEDAPFTTTRPPPEATGWAEPIAPRPIGVETPISPRELHRRVSPAVVALVLSGGPTKAAVVPGVLVTASGLVITSRSVIGNAIDGSATLALVTTRFRKGKASWSRSDATPARVVAVAEDLDLAMVEAMPRTPVFYAHLPVARRSTASGANLWTVGHERQRGLWCGAPLSVGEAMATAGAARWQRAVMGSHPPAMPGSPLVDGVGRIAGLVVDRRAAKGEPIAVDAEGLLRFLLAAHAPARRFAGVSPMRRDGPGELLDAHEPGGTRSGGIRGARPDGGYDLPTVSRKGNLDRRYPMTTIGAADAASSGDADEFPAVKTRAKKGVRAEPTAVSFWDGRAVQIALADLEKNTVPRSVHVDVGDAPARGASRAAITVVEFGDYHGPDTRAAEATVRTLVQGDSAPARLFWKDADRGDGGAYLLPARAARAAGEQDAFWAMHDRLLSTDRSLASPVTRDVVDDLARQIELDEDAFQSSMASDGLITAIETETNRAATLPILCTPAFVVNGQPVDGGSIAAAALQAAVDDELAARASRSAIPRPPRAIAAGPTISGAAFEPAKLARVIAETTARRKPRPR